MKSTLILLLIFLLAPAHAAASPCAIPGESIHWIADFCMATLETDDEIAASDCIAQELRRAFPDECTAKSYYKRALCELAVARQTFEGTATGCMEDRDFKGPTVEFGGVGN